MHQQTVKPKPAARHTRVILLAHIAVALACAGPGQRATPSATAVRPGITVLLADSIHLIRGRRIALITNQTGIDEHRVSDIDLLRGERARAAGVQLVRLFSPEHGIRGTEDRGNLQDEFDERSGLMVYSLYVNGTAPPADSLLRDVDAIVFDLQDVGTRTWTYTGLMLYTIQTAARLNLPLIVLDRPNPITGLHADGALLDTALANPYPAAVQRPARAYALYPVPLRHGLTMGELARYYSQELGISAPLHVVPAAGWRRAQWFDQTGQPWVKPSPNLPDITSELLYPSLVMLEGSNLSVGRGTAIAFQRFGARWMDPQPIVDLLNGRRLPGLRFEPDTFTPTGSGRAGDGVLMRGVRIVVTNRDSVQSGRLAAAITWALVRAGGDSLRITENTFDLRFGSSADRAALMAGADPDSVWAQQRRAVEAFERRADRIRIYR